MDQYSTYIWTAYAIALCVLSFLLFSSVKTLRKNNTALEQLKEPQRSQPQTVLQNHDS